MSVIKEYRIVSSCWPLTTSIRLKGSTNELEINRTDPPDPEVQEDSYGPAFF